MGGWIFGVGPAFLLPTATTRFSGPTSAPAWGLHFDFVLLFPT